MLACYFITGNRRRGTSLVVRQLKLHTPSAESPGWIPEQGTRSHMLQLRVHKGLEVLMFTKG